MYVYAVPQFYCSSCGQQLEMESFGPFLYGWFILVSHYTHPSLSEYCHQAKDRFFWNPQEHRERHV